MSAHSTAEAPHTYRANEHDTVLSEVSRVICILLPRAFLIAGFNGDGQAVMARYNSYPASEPAWRTAFFEQEFMSETLLGVPQQVKSVFIGSNEEMLIPAAVYAEHAATEWMDKLHALNADDVLLSYKLDVADAWYVNAIPSGFSKLLGRYFGGTPILPVATYQFHRPGKSGYVLQCLASEETVFATLYNSGRLLWHQRFAYSGAEDIAWQAVFLCRELHIPRIDLQIQLTTVSDSLAELGPELERYFPKSKWSLNTPNDDGVWAPVVYLLQQLYACAL